MSRSSRLLLGLAAILLALGGAALLLWGGSRPTTGEVMVRASLVLGAIWLVAPEIRRPALATILWLVVGALVLVRPRLAVVVVVASVVWWVGRRARR